MNRRASLLASEPCSPRRLSAEAQQARKVYRIGYLSVSQVEFDKSWVGAFRDGLRELGRRE